MKAVFSKTSVSLMLGPTAGLDVETDNSSSQLETKPRLSRPRPARLFTNSAVQSRMLKLSYSNSRHFDANR